MNNKVKQIDNERVLFIGDLHSCADELCELLQATGHMNSDQNFISSDEHIVFLGDITDRGPYALDCLHLVRLLVEEGHATCLMGNHDNKLYRYLIGNKVRVSHGLQRTIDAIDNIDPRDRESDLLQVTNFIAGLPMVALGKSWVASHAAPPFVFTDSTGLPTPIKETIDKRQEALCLYGVTSGKLPSGAPNRLSWQESWFHKKDVFTGHEVDWNNQYQVPTASGSTSYLLDGGCCFGGELRGFLYPSNTWVKIKAHKEYYPKDSKLAEFKASQDLTIAKDMKSEAKEQQ